MNKTPVIVIFDIGKTNKKILLFDEQYKIVHEGITQLQETKDEDNFPCEDIIRLTLWVKSAFEILLKDEKYEIKAVNFSAYGASLVYLDQHLKNILPLYNYLKPYPSLLKEKFDTTYGGENLIAKETASPALGNLNSGMQLYRLKYEKPETFDNIQFAIHLPQYLSFIFTGKIYSDITSVGCHTTLWNFKNNMYHSWIKKEGIEEKLAPISKYDEIAGNTNKNIIVGSGLHDSSSALIPYLISFNEPFVLISTGTWCITLNPFNQSPLSDYELQQDCLFYLSYQGKPVKASRLLAGQEHEEQIKKLSTHFNKPLDYYKTAQYDHLILAKLKGTKIAQQTDFNIFNLNLFSNYEEAYHQLMSGIVKQQIHSTNLVLKDTTVKKIIVDGGFSNNSIYINLLAEAYPDFKIFAASVPQASALGAALAIHRHWNSKSLPANLIELKNYSVEDKISKTQ